METSIPCRSLENNEGGRYETKDYERDTAKNATVSR